MGCLQSKPAPEKEIDSGPKVYSWDKRAKSPESTKAKFFIRERIGLENAIHRNDVKEAPITIDACRDTIIFLEGQIKNLIIDECTNVAVVAFVQDSTYIRNSVNCHVILVTGQLRTRDCRQLRLCLHCPTQPVIESTTKVTVSPVKMDFVGVENIAMKHSKFNNQWHKIHDFGPVGDEPNWVTSNTDDHLAELFTKMALHLPLAPKLKCDGGSFYPITMGVSSNSSESGELSESKLVFLLFGGINAEHLATQLYLNLVMHQSRARLVSCCGGAYSPLSLPERSRKQLPRADMVTCVGLLLHGALSAVDLAEFVPAGEAYVTFDQARTDADTLMNARNVTFD